jgi:hypothetical protein
MNAEESMNKSPDEKNASDTGTPREMAEPLQAGPAQSEVIERRSPHRVISTASYYHLERRRRQFGSEPDEFAEGLEAEDEMDGGSGETGFS